MSKYKIRVNDESYIRYELNDIFDTKNWGKGKMYNRKKKRKNSMYIMDTDEAYEYGFGEPVYDIQNY